jgi:hypothetical protein
MAQYMLLLHQNPGTNASLPPESFKEIVQRYYAWSEKMRQQGRLVSGEKLAVGRIRHIRMRDGKPLSSDGPYAEAKDVVGGFWVIEAKDDAEADAIARDCPHLWNDTNWVELRPIDLMTADEAPKAKAVG